MWYTLVYCYIYIKHRQCNDVRNIVGVYNQGGVGYGPAGKV